MFTFLDLLIVVVMALVGVGALVPERLKRNDKKMFRLSRTVALVAGMAQMRSWCKRNNR